jgi:hypothetical protein
MSIHMHVHLSNCKSSSFRLQKQWKIALLYNTCLDGWSYLLPFQLVISLCSWKDKGNILPADLSYKTWYPLAGSSSSFNPSQTILTIKKPPLLRYPIQYQHSIMSNSGSGQHSRSYCLFLTCSDLNCSFCPLCVSPWSYFWYDLMSTTLADHSLSLPVFPIVSLPLYFGGSLPNHDLPHLIPDHLICHALIVFLKTSQQDLYPGIHW